MNMRSAFADFKEFLELLWVNVRVHARNFFEFLRVATHYYTNVRFAKIDLALLLTYLFNNPYVISKKFLLERGEKEVYAYGETPLTTLEGIFKECQVSSTDVVFELGCGRGRTCFWMNTFIGCRVVGIEYIPEFVERANQVKAKFQVDGVQFRFQDMLKTDYSNATVIYLYGTTLDDATINHLITKLQKTAAGTKIITVSYPLTDYASSDMFEVMRCFPARFPWGETDIYLHIKK